MRLGCHQINDQTWGRPLALPENQRECSLKSVRPLTQTTHVASGYILDWLDGSPESYILKWVDTAFCSRNST